MFLVTNRAVHPARKGLAKLGDTPNDKGPNELRLVEATKTGRNWRLDILPDQLDARLKKAVGLADETRTVYASEYAARQILQRVRKQKKNILFFVHGYNNDVEAVLNRAAGLARNDGVEVIAFTWPANGGGLRGLASYKADKRDARASVGALDHALARMYELLNDFNARLLHDIQSEARREHPRDGEARDQYITRCLEDPERGCPFTVNMLLHSMGNYLYKGLLQSSVYRRNLLLFDNIVMAAADVNNQGHAQWVDTIRCRKRIYITINEDDAALMASRMKVGESQRARLGHYPYNLTSRQAVYVDFTDGAYVGSAHAYFEGTPLRNHKIRRFFKLAFNGHRAEIDLRYEPARGMYKIT